jgi:1-acyl-sn-glycerol-3-phosphate acyltransferase
VKDPVKNIIGIVSVIHIIFILSLGVLLLSIISIPRIIPIEAIRKIITAASNEAGNALVWFLKITLGFIHRTKWQIEYPGNISTKKWYLGISNHSSWADIFVLLFISNYKMPLLKFCIKKELRWIPVIYLIHKTIDMPFVNRHSPDEIRKKPGLKTVDFENAKAASQKFTRYPTTAFSFAEGTRFTEAKKVLQSSPFENLLKPKTGALVTALSGMPMVEELIDFTIIYKTPKRSAWDFACGEMNEVKIIVKCYEIPISIRIIDNNSAVFRNEFQKFVDKIWRKKQTLIEEKKYKIS